MENVALSDFKKNIKNKKIAVLGLGGSNIPAIKYLLSMGAIIVCHDQNEAAKEKLDDDIKKNVNVSYKLGKEAFSELENVDYILRTPGIKPFIPEIENAVKHGVILTSEIELLVKLAPCKIIGVTGSAGKTTTTTLIAEFLKNSNSKIWVGGNIGTPLFDKLDEIKKDDIIVLELSSFQLMTMSDSPNISIVTNIYEDHLDYHRNMEEYIEAKTNIFMHQKDKDIAIFWRDDEISKTFIDKMKEKNVNSKIRLFSSKNSVENGAYFENGKIFEVENGMKKEVISVDDIAIKGEKNYLNICAAICAVKDIISIDDIVKTLKSFNGVEHRLEYVDTIFGVKYYNDSISTTPGKAMAALTSFDKKIILIAGGSDKNLDYTSLGDKIINSTKVLILLGATKNKIKKAVLDSKLYDSNKIKLEEVDSLEEAVLIASKISKSGDIVVMSPASASFDMFKNYKERGKLFKNLVNSLKNK